MGEYLAILLTHATSESFDRPFGLIPSKLAYPSAFCGRRQLEPQNLHLKHQRPRSIFLDFCGILSSESAFKNSIYEKETVMKKACQSYLGLVLSGLFGVLFIAGTQHSAEAGIIAASGRISGSIFNSAARQHIQGNFRGSGIHRPSGSNGTANGGLSSLRGKRIPKASLAGPYRVLARANVRYGGGSNSVAKQVTLIVRRRTLSVRGLGVIRLSRPLNLTRTGRQRFSGRGVLTFRGV